MTAITEITEALSRAPSLESSTSDNESNFSTARRSGYVPMLRNHATDEMCGMIGQPFQEDMMTQEKTLTKRGVTLSVISGRNLKVPVDKLSPGAELLFKYGLHKLAQTNNIGPAEQYSADRPVNPVITITVEEYAKITGKDIATSKDMPPAEAKRKKALKDKISRDMRAAVDELRSFSISWDDYVWFPSPTEKNPDRQIKELMTIQANLFDATAKPAKRKGGVIILEFSQKVAANLVQFATITQTPIEYFQIPHKRVLDKQIMQTMANQYARYRNEERGTRNVLKVKTLLEHSGTQGPDSPNVKKHGWQNRIKKPLEDALDRLVFCDPVYLADWYYAVPGTHGQRMTDEEASFTSYEQWIEAVICFAPRNQFSNSDRIKRKEVRQTRKKKKSASTKSEKNAASTSK